jgi:hypothetical protein
MFSNANKSNLWKKYVFKISPPCIEFILPSPPIGIALMQPVDPSWVPKAKTKVQEVTVNQEEVVSVSFSNWSYTSSEYQFADMCV